MGRSDDDSATEILPSATAPGAPATPSAAPAAASLLGRTLGKFTIVERLGEGGSGEVYRAEQQPLGRSAVIKVLRREVANVPNRVERFLREAKLASRLDHPYAAHVYAFGAEPDGVLWIAMEYVRGATLDELIAQRGAIHPAVFAPLFSRLCEVVHSAHELGIVHRDIKGSNIMVIERAGQLLPKLLDFGIAKADGGEVSPGVDDTELTSHGATLGSPHYMSPEQWQSAADVDARADIYALGILAYRAVSGALPFQGVPRPELASAHAFAPPPPLPGSIAPPLADAILRALAKRPDARWPTALAFAEAIRRAVGGAVPESVPIVDPATRDLWVRRAPQPIADAVAHLAGATTTVEADAALRELVAITCRWLAVIALASLGDDVSTPELREKARAAVGRDGGAPWLWLARAAAAEAPVIRSDLISAQLAHGVIRSDLISAQRGSAFSSALRAAVDATSVLEQLAERLDDRERPRTAAALAADVATAADALRPLEPLLAYTLVVGRARAAESWCGARRRNRERLVVWGEPLPDGEVALLDERGAVAVILSPLVQVRSPLPAAEPELFLLWRSARGQARLVAAPWGFERDDEAAAARLAVLTTEDDDTIARDGNESPYPGLAAYGVQDAGRFVGREREIEALANRLVRAPMIAVLGPSGAGKSSFIHAGVMARLAESYELITLRPGRHPVAALRAAPPIGDLSGDGSDTAGIVERLRALGERAPRGLVVVIDQLEELVTLCQDAAERQRFAETLAAAADGPGAPVRVIVTLRDDFATVIESEEALRGKFEVFVLATPPPEALRRIVTEPARRAGVTVDPTVVDDMVAEVAGRPASLPLLSFTASQLWRSRDRDARRITYESYLALGGVAGALSTYADQLYGSLARRDQEVVRDLFARLVASDGTRVPAMRDELAAIPGATKVLGHLIDARLLVVREDDGVDIVEVVHECLAERWDRLARWRSEDAADRALLGDVRVATRRWIEAGRRADLVWHGEALAELRKLAARSGALTDDERAFAAASDRAARRARRVRRGLIAFAMAALAAVALVMAYLSLQANQSRSAAERSAGDARDAAKLAEDRLTAGLVAQGRRELNDNRGLAALAYFAEALRRGADTPGLRFMIALAARGMRHEERVLSSFRASAITALPVGFALGDADGRVHFFDGAGAPAGVMEVGQAAIGVLRVRGDRMAATTRNGIVLIDVPRRSVLGRIETGELVTTSDAGPALDEVTAVTPDGVRIYGADGKERRRLDRDLSQADAEPVFGERTLFVAHGRTVVAIDLVTLKDRVIAEEVYAGPGGSADSQTIVYVDKQRRAHVLDGTGAPVLTFTPSVRAEQLYVSMTGDRFGAINDRALGIYDRTGKELRTVPLSPQDEELLVRLRGDDVWTGSTHGVIRHYKGHVLVASLPAHTTEIEDMRVSGDHLVSVGFDATVVVHRASAEQLVVDEGPCRAGSFSISGPAIGYVCEDGRALVYIGKRLLGTVADHTLMHATLDPASGRSAVVTAKELAVFDPAGVVLATQPDRRGPVVFEDPEHLLVVIGEDGAQALGRLTIATGAWQQLAPVTEPTAAIAIAAGGVLLGGKSAVRLVRAGPTGVTEVATVPTGEGVQFLAVSGDRRFVSAHLENGATLILDGGTAAIVRRFEPVESYGVAAMLDATGDLVLRTSRGTLTVWDRATGDNLVWNLEFLRGAFGAAFLPDGRIETVGDRLGLIDIPRETRPVAEILADIACRVPLRVTGSRLDAAPTQCPH
ncbi:MAG: serine/threonine-protein kinase PknK [Myxococcales bacterium]|nr:serine/threonine-protein kinase PknK [Myxococcales bacterium]